MRFARALCGGRAVEWHCLIQMVLGTPFLLFGTVDEMTAQVLASRERYGFSYLTVHDPYMEAFAPVVAALKG